MVRSLISKRFKYDSDSSSLISLSKVALDAKISVERKIREGIYKFENRACFCGSNDFRKISELDRYGFYYPVVICKHCGLIRANPRMTLDSYKEFYDKEYRILYGDCDIKKDELWLIRINQGKQVYEFIMQNVSNLQGVVFDIGCNMGTTLIPFWQNGFEVAGVDYGSDFLEYGEKRSGINNLYVGGIEKLKEFGKKADIIILTHVLEHFLDLEQELSNIREIMKPGGYIYIETPGTLSWTKGINSGNFLGMLNNAHTYQFSLTWLIYLMECSGFELLVGDEWIRTIFKMKNTFRNKTDIPKNEYKRITNFLERTEMFFTLRQYLFRLFKRIPGYVYLKEIVKKSFYIFRR